MANLPLFMGHLKEGEVTVSGLIPNWSKTLFQMLGRLFVHMMIMPNPKHLFLWNNKLSTSQSERSGLLLNESWGAF